ncbi:ammonium transporter mep1B [Lophiotrema nucula]|uniref:Ammonium transporter n=1 Tax=Lophiotrema nucula TaxID=690887 RepID=A0A6A5YVT8_9PLEO|nr:ammonium transporter mep1B [Lophiotrema nucula]
MAAESPTAPDWLDKGDNAWQLTAGSLVALQSVPGLMILYAGMVPTKWAVNSAFMAFYAFASVLICWVIYAYKAAFGKKMLPFVGVPGPVVEMDWELRQAVLPSANITANFPLSTMVYFQFVFAAITVILMAGAFLGRMSFKAWMIFVPLWLTLSYTVGAFSIWGGGFLFWRGVIDYSGGYVIHLSSGTAGFVGSYWIGPRLKADREAFTPHSTLLMLTGAGILWIGWNGFNGGDPYAASPDAGAAVLNTNICTAMSLLVWTALDIIFFKKPSTIGATQGMITGLVAITPAAGVVAGWGAIIIGVCSGSVPWITMNVIAKKLKFMEKFDDTLGVVHTHAVAGALGGFLVGIFATAKGCIAFAAVSPGGAIAGNGKQVGWQIAGACFIIAWNTFWTSAIMLFIKYVLRIPLRMTEEELLIGDDAIHGESAYTFGDAVHMHLPTTLHGKEVRKVSDVEATATAEGSKSKSTSNGGKEDKIA